MTDMEQELKLGELGGLVAEAVKTAATHWQSKLSEKLIGITVVGSCLTADYRPGTSDINTVLLVDGYSLAVLDQLATSRRGLPRKHRIAAPLLMTEDYIARSRDVFGVEFLDFQLNHQTILGKDPFNDLAFTKSEVRLQCERELKASLIRMRQGYIAACNKEVLIRDVLIAAVKSLGPLLRALFWLTDQPREVTLSATYIQAGPAFNVDSAVLTTVASWQHEKAHPKGNELRSTFDRVYSLIDHLAGYVDGLESGS